jgi:hypothetical protein
MRRPTNARTKLVGVAVVISLSMIAAGAVAAGLASKSSAATQSAALSKLPAVYVDAMLSWGEKCLRDGESCKLGNPEYHARGFGGVTNRTLSSRQGRFEWVSSTREALLCPG